MSSTESNQPPMKLDGNVTQGSIWTPAIVASIVSGIFSLLSVTVSYLLVERNRTDFQRQTVELDRVKTDLAAQTLSLERSKAEIAAASQRTSEVLAQIDEQRLRLERQVAVNTAKTEDRRLQLETAKGRTDEVRITPDFTKLLNELRPNLDVKCAADDSRWPSVRLTCKTKNIGHHKVHIRSESLALLDFATKQIVPAGLKRVDFPPENSVSVGVEGESLLDAQISADAAARKEVIFEAVFTSQTDDIATKVATRLAKGVLTEKEIADAAIQRHTFTLQFRR